MYTPLPPDDDQPFIVSTGQLAAPPLVEALVKAVAEHRADYGIALDGDADRLQMVDAQGRLYNGDELLYVMAADRLALRQPVPGVVGTLMTNMAVEVALKRASVPMVGVLPGRLMPTIRWTCGWPGAGWGSGPSAACRLATV